MIGLVRQGPAAAGPAGCPPASLTALTGLQSLVWAVPPLNSTYTCDWPAIARCVDLCAPCPRASDPACSYYRPAVTPARAPPMRRARAPSC